MAAVSHFIVLNAKKQSLFYDFFLLCSKKQSKEATTAQIWTKQSRPHVCDTDRHTASLGVFAGIKKPKSSRSVEA